MEKETRNTGNIALAPVELREGETESRHVSGYAAVYSRLSEDLGGFREVIEPGAFDGVAEKSDIMCLLNHNDARGILARSRQGSGSLTVRADELGLFYEFDAPRTSLGDELLEGLKRGDISQSSFAFTVESEQWDKQDDGTYLRHILKVGALYDVSPVYRPAYPDTTVANRAYEAEKAKETEPMPQAYYDELTNRI